MNLENLIFVVLFLLKLEIFLRFEKINNSSTRNTEFKLNNKILVQKKSLFPLSCFFLLLLLAAFFFSKQNSNILDMFH